MPRVHLFLRNEPEISELLYVKSAYISCKRDLTIDLAADCYPSAGSSYLLNSAQQVCRLIMFFDETEAMQYFNGIVGLSDQKWIPVNEKLPEYRENVLVFAKKDDWLLGRIKICQRLSTDWAGEHWSDNYGYCITHWMPLPAPPTELTGQYGGDKL